MSFPGRLRKYNPINAHQAGATAIHGQRHVEQRSSAAVALDAFTEGGKCNLGNAFQPHNKLAKT